MTKAEKKWLKSICIRCKEVNGFCVKRFSYIGLCAKKDRDELLEMKRKEGLI